MSEKRTNPVMIGTAENKPMKAWDLEILVGNFASESEAREAGVKVAKMMERELGVEGSVVQ